MLSMLDIATPFHPEEEESEEQGFKEAEPEPEDERAVETTDWFDLLPDSLVVLILNKVSDIKVLGRCCAVSKRLHELTGHVEDVVVKVDCVISGEDGNLSAKGRGFLGHLVRFVFGSIVKPLQLLHTYLGPKKSSTSSSSSASSATSPGGLAEVSHHSPSEVLRSFKEIRHLRIELPGGELGIEDGVLLKWKAEFGSTLESCVILGAASVDEGESENDSHVKVGSGGGGGGSGDGSGGGGCGGGGNTNTNNNNNTNNNMNMLGKGGEVADGGGEAVDGGCIPDSFYTDGGLKKRVVWTISSLIAASARHYLLQQIICDHVTLESLVLTDADGQGMLCMSRRQLAEFREKQPVAASASSSRTQVPDLNMKLWYAPSLNLPGGCSMKGVTLVAIRPSSDQQPVKDEDGFITQAFGEPFRSAACVLSRRRTYLLEMNSF